MAVIGFLLYTLFIPLGVFGVSQWLDKKTGRQGNMWVLVSACILFGISYFFPSPQIHGEQTQFMTHLHGGGVFCGLLWVYHRSKITIPKTWQWELGGLFVVTSALGVLNELYELLSFEYLGGAPVRDTSYDLFANTLGVLLFFVVYRLILVSRGKRL